MHGKKQKIALLIGGAIIVIAMALVVYLSPPGTLPGCLFHSISSLHCPGCGMTRALRFLLHGELLLSLRCNVLLIPIGAVLAALLYKPELGLKVYFAYSIAFTVIGFAILRNLPCFPFTLLAPV